MSGDDRSVMALAVLVERVAQVHRDAGVRALHEQGVPDALAGLLWVLGRGEGDLGMRELAEALACDPSNVTQLTRRLEEQGLVERVTDPTDRRRRVPRLTAEGREVSRRLVAAVEQASPLAGLTAQERALLGDALAAGLG